MYDDMKSGQRRVIMDETSPSKYSTVDKTEDSFVITHLAHGEMPFLLIGGFGNMPKNNVHQCKICC
jgi:hypothetical protein